MPKDYGYSLWGVYVVWLAIVAALYPVSTVLRALFCAIALLPPTALMGASLPAIARWAKTSARGVSWWGLLYGIALTTARSIGNLALMAHELKNSVAGFKLPDEGKRAAG